MPQERATRLHLPANIALSERARQTPVCLNALRFLSDLVTTLLLEFFKLFHGHFLQHPVVSVFH